MIGFYVGRYLAQELTL